MIHLKNSTKTLTLLSLSAGLALGVSAPAHSQPETDTPGLAQNPPNRGAQNRADRAARRANRANRANRPNRRGENRNGEQARLRAEERELAMAEAVAGKPLTDEQKQKVRESVALREAAVRAAREKYIADMAASLGMEPDEVRLKLRTANGRRNRDAAQMPVAAGAPAMAPAAR